MLIQLHLRTSRQTSLGSPLWTYFRLAKLAFERFGDFTITLFGLVQKLAFLDGSLKQKCT
jgi:hypothetical protein